jgi:2',3'-cyclic-nucleotide 2'-phosphodiesterase (5'-nucleotidase family)
MRKIVFCMLAFSLLFMSCSTSDLKNEQLTIIYSGNIGGQINPCGCKIPMGGYARKSSVMKFLQGEKGDNLLVLDSGGLLFNTNFLKPPTDSIHRHHAFVATQIIEKLGFDAINVSSFDLSNSVDSLLAIDKASSISWMSSNLVWRDSGEAVFRTGTVLSKGNLNIGLFGLMSDKFLGASLYDNSSPLKVLDSIETAKKEVSALKDETDIIIALSYMSEKETTAFCEAVSGIDVVILSHNGYHNADVSPTMFSPMKIGKTLLLRCPDGGRVLGVSELEMVNGSGDFKEVAMMRKASESIDESKEYAGEKDSKFTNTFYILNAEIRTDTDIQDEIDKYEEGLQQLKLDVGVF